jgi:hypothetical protein
MLQLYHQIIYIKKSPNFSLFSLTHLHPLFSSIFSPLIPSLQPIVEKEISESPVNPMEPKKC